MTHSPFELPNKGQKFSTFKQKCFKCGSYYWTVDKHSEKKIRCSNCGFFQKGKAAIGIRRDFCELLDSQPCTEQGLDAGSGETWLGEAWLGKGTNGAEPATVVTGSF